VFVTCKRLGTIRQEEETRVAERLIGRLVQTEAFGVGYDAWSDSRDFFLPTDRPEDLVAQGFLLDELPTFSPAMSALVGRGVEAIPALISHLDDARTVKVGVVPWETHRNQDDPGRVWAAYRFELGNDNEPRFEGHVNSLPFIVRDIDGHWITVGDLCYAAIGQIVNRNLNVLKYGGSNCGSVMSPGRLHGNSFACKDFEQVVFIECGRETFVLDTNAS